MKILLLLFYIIVLYFLYFSLAVIFTCTSCLFLTKSNSWFQVYYYFLLSAVALFVSSLGFFKPLVLAFATLQYIYACAYGSE